MDGYRIYREEVTLWTAVSGVEKKYLGAVLWLELARTNPGNINDLILASEGAEWFIAAMGKAFKPTSQCREIKIYNNFYRDMQRKTDKKMNDFVNRFEKASNVTNKAKMELPTKVKELKLLANAGLSDQDMKLVLTEVDFNKEEEVYSKAKLGLTKYINSEGTATNPPIKVEPVMTAQLEVTLVACG